MFDKSKRKSTKISKRDSLKKEKIQACDDINEIIPLMNRLQEINIQYEDQSSKKIFFNTSFQLNSNAPLGLLV